MRKQQLKIIANLVSIFLLCTTLLISISFGWYTNNKEVHANGLHASSATDSLIVSNQGAYSAQIGTDEPNPNDPNLDKDNEVTGVLAGEIVYFSVSITSSEENKMLTLNDLKIAVSSIFGDEYFTEPSVEYTGPVTGAGSLIDTNYITAVSTYSSKDRVIQSIMRLEGYQYDYFISMDKDGKHYINNVEITDGDVKVVSSSKLTDDEELAYYQSGTLTGHKYVYDEIETYPTYKDPSGKEYYITYVDGKYYINYIYETEEKDSDGNTLLDKNNNPVVRRYNMIDIYTYELYKVYGREDLNDKSDNAYKTIYTAPSATNHSDYKGGKFPKTNGLDKSISMFTLYDPTYFAKNTQMLEPEITNLLAEEHKELTYVFKFVFDYNDYKDKINISSVSYKEIKFNNVIISFYEQKDEGGNT